MNSQSISYLNLIKATLATIGDCAHFNAIICKQFYDWIITNNAVVNEPKRLDTLEARRSSSKHYSQRRHSIKFTDKTIINTSLEISFKKCCGHYFE